MPSIERGVYEPKPDDIRVFDEDEQDLDEEGSRLPLLIVIALLVLAAFGGVVWLAYNQGVQRGRSDAPRMIVAAPGPVKEAAANTGTTHNLKIYQQPAPNEDEMADSDLVTPPANETAGPPASAKPAPAAMTAKPEETKPAVAVAAKPEAAKPAPAKLAAQEPPKPAPKVETTAPKPVAAKPSASAAKPIETAALPPVAGAKEAPAGAAAATGGGYMLQIGSYKSQAEADSAWKTFQLKHAIAGSYSENVVRADLGSKGIWYRLRMGPFAGKSAAAAFCDKLKADGGSCLIAK